MTFFKGKLVLLQPYCVGLRLKDENRGLQRSNSKLQEQVALLQAEFKKSPGDAKD